MSIDPELKLHPIATAFELVTGNRPSSPTVWRWKTVGCRGVKLPFTQVGGTAMLSIADVRRWLGEVTTVASQEKNQEAIAK